jgi:hypothetical protein
MTMTASAEAGRPPAASTGSAAKPAAPKRPSAARRMMNSAVALREQRQRMVQLTLFAAGAVLMPFGLLAIGLGWYGTAHSKYDYDQRTYLISGGVMGLGLAFVGGFLYFGAWLAKMANDQRDASRQLADSLAQLASSIDRQTARAAGVPDIDGAQLVLAGDGTTVHRRDCPLISRRDDLHPLTGTETGLLTCRVCRPDTV